MLLLSYICYIKLIIQHIMILSDAQRNLTIFVLYKCSPYTSNINVQNYHSSWSYNKNFLSLNPKSYLGGPGPSIIRQYQSTYK